MRAITLCVLLSVLGAYADGQNLLLWDGETACSLEYGKENQEHPFHGEGCFEAVPDAYHEPRICLNGLASWRTDLSGFDEIWFFAKCSETGKTFEFSVSGYPNVSKRVSVDSYIQGGRLDTQYRLVRIPVASLKTDAYPLNVVENLRFGVAKPSPGHKIYVDEVWAVKLAACDPERSPLVGALPPVHFDDVAVGSSQEKALRVANIGKVPLHVGEIEIQGRDAASFSAKPSHFEVPPGQEVTLNIAFRPQVPGDMVGMLVFHHDATPVGSVSHLSAGGRCVGPLIGLSSTDLAFGSVPVGSTADLPVVLSNTGNQPLAVVSIASTDPSFHVSQQDCTIPLSGKHEVVVTFAPKTTAHSSGMLKVASNDPVKGVSEVALTGGGAGAGEDAALKVSIDETASDAVRVSWPKFQGAEEVRVSIASEPGANPICVATLPGTAVNHTIEKLAASADVFIQVAVSAGGRVLAAGDAHARLPGGPGAELKTPVREIHLAAPNIIEIVMANPEVKSFSGANGSLSGYTGADLQAGPWNVRRQSGEALAVMRVHRHSVPVGQRYYELGYGTNTHDDLIDVDHHIYLVLAAPLKSGEIYRIEGPLGTDVLLPFSDRYIETPSIQLNQVGYCPRASRRYAYVSGWLGDGGALPLANFPKTAEVLVEPVDAMLPRTAAKTNLAVVVRSPQDEDAGCEVREIDLSSVPPAEGTVFRVRLPGIGVSWPTQVSETAVFKAFYTMARGLYHNRRDRDL